MPGFRISALALGQLCTRNFPMCPKPEILMTAVMTAEAGGDGGEGLCDDGSGWKPWCPSDGRSATDDNDGNEDFYCQNPTVLAFGIRLRE